MVAGGFDIGSGIVEFVCAGESCIVGRAELAPRVSIGVSAVDSACKTDYCFSLVETVNK
jgi:hypothetical protein